MYEAMKLFGLNGWLGERKIQPGDVYAFIEMHIEQGRVLESSVFPGDCDIYRRAYQDQSLCYR